VTGQRDWYTIVREQRCPECGLEVSAVRREELADGHRRAAAAWADVLAGPTARLRDHLVPGTWSALEYACHVRDVLQRFDERARLACRVDRPEFGWWDHDAAVESERYNDQDPLTVARALGGQAEALAETLGGLGDREWERTGTRVGQVFSVEELARFSLHESLHHLADARARLA